MSQDIFLFQGCDNNYYVVKTIFVGVAAVQVIRYMSNYFEPGIGRILTKKMVYKIWNTMCDIMYKNNVRCDKSYCCIHLMRISHIDVKNVS